MSTIKEFYQKYLDKSDQIQISVFCGPLLCTLEQAHLMNRHQHVNHHEIRYSNEASVWTKCVDQSYYMQLKLKSNFMKKSENYWQEDRAESFTFTAIADTEDKLIEEFEKYLSGLPYELIANPRKQKK